MVKFQLAGVIYAGNDTHYLLFLPNEEMHAVDMQFAKILELNLEEWKALFYQSDVVEREIATDKNKKIIMRKTQRQVDANVTWTVYKRDNYTCRYCGKDGIPLTIDHIICWEDGGPTIEENLLTTCKKCNRIRGNMPYSEWLKSEEYDHLSEGIPISIIDKNYEIERKLDLIPRTTIRSR